MYTQKTIVGKFLFEICQACFGDDLFFVGKNLNIFAQPFNVKYFVEVNFDNPFVFFHINKGLFVGAVPVNDGYRSVFLFNQFEIFVYRFQKALKSNWFQQKVYYIESQTLYGIHSISGGNNHFWTVFEYFQELETRNLGHLNIHKH